MKSCVAIALATLGSGCIFSFDNPVQSQGAGSVAGHLQLGTSATGQSLAGARVDLLWSDLSVTVDAQGQFAFLSLPDGTYTLRYTVPAVSSNDIPAIGELRDIYLPPLPGGGSDALTVGTLTVNTAGTVEGLVAGTDGGAVVAAFTPDLPDGGLGAYEGFSTSTDDAGHYVLLLPAGDHELWASSSTQSTSVTVTVDAGEVVSQDFEVSGKSAVLEETELVGYAVLGDLGASASVSEVQAIANGLQVGLAPAACSTCGLSLAFQTPDPRAGISAVQLTQLLQPGQLYDIEVSPAAAGTPGQPLFVTGIPAVAGRTTFMQQIFVFSAKTLAANAAVAVDAGQSISGVSDGGLPGADGGVGLPDGGTATDAGGDAGSTADAGSIGDGGSTRDGGLGDGGEPVDDGGEQDSGPAPAPPQWTMQVSVPAGQYFPMAIVLLPYPGDPSADLLAFEDNVGGIWTTDDHGNGMFGPPVPLDAPDAGLVAVFNTLAGAGSDGSGGNALVWGGATQAGGPISDVQFSATASGQWPAPSGALTPDLLTASYPLAIAYDSSGVTWLAEATTAGLTMVQLGGQDTQVTHDFDGGNPESIAAVSCSVGICLAWTDPSGNVWMGAYETMTGTITAAMIFDAAANGSLAGGFVPSIASLPGGGVVTAWQPAPPSTTSPSLYTVQWSSPSGPASSAPTRVGPSQGPPLVLPWQGGALAISPVDLLGISGMQAATVGINPGANYFEAGIQTDTQPSGYVDGQGTLHVALYDGENINMYTISP